MKLINFDEHFQEYTTDWVRKNGDKFKNNYDRMEEKMPEVYREWLNVPADWLDGATPGAYFVQFDSATDLTQWMRTYAEAGVPVPDQLLERLTAMGNGAEEALFALLSDQEAAEEARMTAISLLSEMESVLPMMYYVNWISMREAGDSGAEMAAEALTAMGQRVVAPILEAVSRATMAGKETFADILCNFPGEDAFYTLVETLFQREREKRALYASLLGKLGDTRAIPLLQEALEDIELGYLDYIALRNALEALGSEAPKERAFDGDPFFESLRRME